MADRPFAIEEWFFEIPVVTRTYMTLVALASVACQMQLISPFHLFYYWPLISKQRQYWRLITTFLYFGNISFDLFFHVFFMMRYMRWAEETRCRGKKLDFAWMLFLLGFGILVLASIFDKKKQMPFLSTALSCAISYIWGRHNPDVRMSLMGLFTFSAPYLPYVMIGISVLLGGRVPMADAMGIVVGHIYYYFDHIYPRLPHSQGYKPLSTPTFLYVLFGEQENLENPELQGDPVPPTIGEPAVPPEQQIPERDASGTLDNDNSLRHRHPVENENGSN